MKVRMFKLAASDLGIFQPGDVVDLPDDVAKKFISVGAAIPIEEKKEIETESIEVEEKAVLQKGKNKKLK